MDKTPLTWTRAVLHDHRCHTLASKVGEPKRCHHFVCRGSRESAVRLIYWGGLTSCQCEWELHIRGIQGALHTETPLIILGRSGTFIIYVGGEITSVSAARERPLKDSDSKFGSTVSAQVSFRQR